MLPAAQRLTSPASFRDVVRGGHRCGGALLVAHLLVPAGDPDDAAPGATRVGMVVSKAVGNAVTRNLVKRRLRHLVKAELAGLPEGSLVVLRAQPASASASYVELGEELTRCLRRVRSRSVGSTR